MALLPISRIFSDQSRALFIFTRLNVTLHSNSSKSFLRKVREFLRKWEKCIVDPMVLPIIRPCTGPANLLRLTASTIYLHSTKRYSWQTFVGFVGENEKKICLNLDICLILPILRTRIGLINFPRPLAQSIISTRSNETFYQISSKLFEPFSRKCEETAETEERAADSDT